MVLDQVVDEIKLVHLVAKMVARPSNQFMLEARTQMTAAIFLQKQERYCQLIGNLPFFAVRIGPLQSIILANGRYDEHWWKWKQQRKVLKERKITFENTLILENFLFKGTVCNHILKPESYIHLIGFGQIANRRTFSTDC